MSDLPDRPDLGQLRRRAREVLRSAQNGDSRALERLTLASAQLAVAREYGFASWARLRREVERRRAVPPLPKSWERFGYPDYLTAGADELVAGQYADRQRLRPVLDAVLALLPALGPVTVQARKTCVCLVTPRRTFAVVQPTTKSRVDLWLRLADTEPAGRLLASGRPPSGSVTMRVPLAGPDDVDDEVAGWLRRAYEESSSPPAPRRRARRPVPVLGPLPVLVEGYDLPGRSCRPEPDGTIHRNIHVGLCGRGRGVSGLVIPGRPWLATGPVPGDAAKARWVVAVTVRRGEDGLDFGGPYVRGDRGDRHLCLAWGDVPGDGTLRLFRGAKLRFADIEPGLIGDAMRPGRRLVARVRLTDARGNPVCARVAPPDVAWSAGRAGDRQAGRSSASTSPTGMLTSTSTTSAR